MLRKEPCNEIPLQLTPEVGISLSPGGQNVLVEKILRDFANASRQVGVLSMLATREDKGLTSMRSFLGTLAYNRRHGKMPDVVVFHTEKNWLVLVELSPVMAPLIQSERRIEKAFGASSAAPSIRYRLPGP